ncbi:hypothetical protein ACFQL7_21115 [Halocatena marina]|nr:hypothetical protein [Halocatena marina]
MATETDPTTDEVSIESTRSEREPPGPDGLPVIGNTFALASDVFGFYERLAHEYEGDVAHYRVAGDTGYLLTHPDHVEQVL